jgi:pyruvate dehydrogenase complex dehydrogenase (E1) component
MSRLTNKVDGKYYPIMNQYGYDNVRRDIYNKLGQIEDILEEYDIEDLRKLKKGLDDYNNK